MVTHEQSEAVIPRVDDPVARFSADWNRRAFSYKHSLADHPLFQPEQLAGLARRLPQSEDFVFWRNGKTGIDGQWVDDTPPTHSITDTLLNMEETDSLVILKHAEQDPEFGPVLQEFIRAYTNHLLPEQLNDILMGEALIFVNSPNRVTHYHMDGEAVIVAQICGTKSFRVFDQTDRDILPLTEIEDYCRGNPDAAVLKPHHLDRSPIYELGPGDGVHIPVNAPHCAESGNDVAISITFTFDLKSAIKRRRLHLLNYHLRKRGLPVLSIGAAPLLEGAINQGLKLAARLSRRPHSQSTVANYPVWTPNGIQPRMVFD